MRRYLRTSIRESAKLLTQQSSQKHKKDLVCGDFCQTFSLRNLIHVDCKSEIKNGGLHANYLDMMGANTPILEYLLPIYAQSFDYSFLNCKAKIKIQRYIKEHKSHCGKHSWILSNFYGYQTQSKNYVFRRHFPYFFTYFQN